MSSGPIILFYLNIIKQTSKQTHKQNKTSFKFKGVKE